jgi:hypothetical protein
MNSKVYKFMFFAVLAASVTLFSGCRSKPKADLYGSGDNLYGTDILDGDPMHTSLPPYPLFPMDE